MSNINVNRSLSDQFYRYKMPRILAKVEGKGNGIKTVVVNMVEVAKALNRPPTYPTKYFGCELGAQTQFDLKNERYIVNGSHEASKLQDLLDGFIRKFVLCASCDNPETVLTVLPKKGVINTKCIACGYSSQLDSTHKLTTFILKNPPGQDPTKNAQSGKKGKRKGKDDKTPKKQQNGDDNGSQSPQHDSDQENGSPEKQSENEDDWCEDTDANAVARRMECLTAGAKGLMLNDDLEKTPQERLDLFYEFVKRHKETGCIENLQKELVGEAERLDIKDKAVLVLCELLLGENIIQEVKKHRLLFLRFTHEAQKAQKYLLGGLEQVINLHKDTLMIKVPHVLKVFYDGDILEEEVLIEWFQKVSKKYVSKEVAVEIREKAKPFITWLQEAEEEESSEDEDEEEAVEVVYSDRHISSSIKVEKEPPKSKPAVTHADDDEGDDVDIDAI